MQSEILMKRSNNGVDRRRFKRIAFTASDEIAGRVLLPNDSEAIFKIADIGAGGMRFIPLRKEAVELIPGAQLFLTRIQGSTRLKFLSRLKLIVRWIIDEAQFSHVMIGCEFFDISEMQKHQIDLFVAAEARNLEKNT
jgi:c-di-GMP-binding flagellar brake protein YcgR